MDKYALLLELQTKHVEQSTKVSKLERKMLNEQRELSPQKNFTSIDLQDAYYELFRLKDQINELQAEIEYDELPFWTKLRTKKPY